jgi:hypothetical protein
MNIDIIEFARANERIKVFEKNVNANFDVINDKGIY